MPHLIIEYSANLTDHLDIEGLVDTLHRCAAGQEALPVGGLRTRAHASDEYLLADGHPDNAFVAVYLRVGEGRSLELREQIGRALFAALRDATADLFRERPLALSLEVQEIDPRTRWNENNLREHMAQRGQ